MWVNFGRDGTKNADFSWHFPLAFDSHFCFTMHLLGPFLYFESIIDSQAQDKSELPVGPSEVHAPVELLR